MQIVIETGQRAGEAFPMEDHPIHIGRDPSSTIVLDDTRVSREHALLEPSDGGSWVCRDLQSTNCTFLNGDPVTTAVLKEGDVIRIGSTELRMATTGEPSATRDGEIELAVDPQSIELALRTASSEEISSSLFQEALFKIGLLSDPEQSEGTFLQRAIEVIGGCIPHRTGAWLDWPESREEPRVLGVRDGSPVTLETLGGSRPFIERVRRRATGLTGGESECTFDLDGDAIALASLAVPVLSGDGVAAILYLDRRSNQTPFVRQDLERAAALAAQVQVDLVNLGLYRRLQAAFEELRQSQSELVRNEKMAAIGRLSSGFAHDLNNPLGSILAFLELAMRAIESSDAAVPEKLPGFLERARGAADYCRALSRNLLAFARERPAKDGENTSFDARSVIEQTLNICHATLQRSQVRCTVDVPEEVWLRGDSSSLQQVLVNLVTNAADALEEMPDGHHGEIRVQGTRVPGGLEVRVTDNGPGIPAELQERIFEPLFTTKAEDRGTGLGLFVVLRVMQESGGRITLDSHVGIGTSFILFLPTALAPLEDGNPDETVLEIQLRDPQEDRRG